VSRRARAISFLVAAVICAVLAAALVNGYRTRVSNRFGELRPVVVAAAELTPGRPLGSKAIGKLLEVRRIPVSFVPPDALTAPQEALGLSPAAAVPAGSYVLGSQLAAPAPSGAQRPSLGPGRRPVEIAVTGAAALEAAGIAGGGGRVDVVVTEEPKSGGRGDTYVAAANVPLLSLNAGAAEPSAEPGAGTLGTSSATLALTRREALELIAAENFARQVRLLPS